MVPLIAGVAVVLLFSISPIRSVNGLMCLGVVAGGFVAASLMARANENKLETTRGLRMGARVGFVAALIVMAVDFFGQYITFRGTPFSGVEYFDPIPKYLYAAIYGIYDGLLDMVSRGEADEGLQWPGRFARYVILTGSTVLFGAFGGVIAASTVNQTSREEEPENRPETPYLAGHMRHSSYPAIQFNPVSEARIYQPPEPAGMLQQAPAATGTHGTPTPEASGYAPGGSPPQGVQRMPQPVFDQAAQMQAARRPHDPVSVAQSPGPPFRNMQEEHEMPQFGT